MCVSVCVCVVLHSSEAFVKQILDTMVLTFLCTYIPKPIAEILF